MDHRRALDLTFDRFGIKAADIARKAGIGAAGAFSLSKRTYGFSGCTGFSNNSSDASTRSVLLLGAVFAIGRFRDRHKVSHAVRSSLLCWSICSSILVVCSIAPSIWSFLFSRFSASFELISLNSL
jgi:hypothetical protein